MITILISWMLLYLGSFIYILHFNYHHNNPRRLVLLSPFVEEKIEALSRRVACQGGWATGWRSQDSQPSLTLKSVLSQPHHIACKCLNHRSHHITHEGWTCLLKRIAWQWKGHFFSWVYGWETPPVVNASYSPLHRIAVTHGSGVCKPVWEGFGNFHFVFLKTKELGFGRILHAQLCRGDTVSSFISHFAYLHEPPAFQVNQ